MPNQGCRASTALGGPGRFSCTPSPNLAAWRHVEIEQWTENVLPLKKDDSRASGPHPNGAQSSPCESGAPMRDTCNPKGIASISPRLARQGLPWVNGQQSINRNVVLANRC